MKPVLAGGPKAERPGSAPFHANNTVPAVHHTGGSCTCSWRQQHPYSRSV